MPRPAEADQYWMVSRKLQPGQVWGNPKLRHPTYAKARKEAQRLADLTGEPRTEAQIATITGEAR